VQVAQGGHDVFGAVAVRDEANQGCDPLFGAGQALPALREFARCVAVALAQEFGDALPQVVEL
jgi:hypothetical protein